MTPASYGALLALVDEAARTWMPPPSADDDPGAAWREYRIERDAGLIERFAALLEAERLALERDMQASAPREPGEPLH